MTINQGYEILVLQFEITDNAVSPATVETKNFLRTAKAAGANNPTSWAEFSNVQKPSTLDIVAKVLVVGDSQVDRDLTLVPNADSFKDDYGSLYEQINEFV